MCKLLHLFSEVSRKYTANLSLLKSSSAPPISIQSSTHRPIPSSLQVCRVPSRGPHRPHPSSPPPNTRTGDKGPTRREKPSEKREMSAPNEPNPGRLVAKDCPGTCTPSNPSGASSCASLGRVCGGNAFNGPGRKTTNSKDIYFNYTRANEPML